MKQTKRIIKLLEEAGDRSFKKGYHYDAASYWAKAKNLELQEKLISKFDAVEKQMKYVWQSLDKLELVKE